VGEPIDEEQGRARRHPELQGGLALGGHGADLAVRRAEDQRAGVLDQPEDVAALEVLAGQPPAQLRREEADVERHRHPVDPAHAPDLEDGRAHLHAEGLGHLRGGAHGRSAQDA
jgi:hypothetical protein